MDLIQKNLLEQVADLHDVPKGAYNIRANGKLDSRNTTANIDIVTKSDKPGIDIIIKPGTKNESVHIPVLISESGIETPKDAREAVSSGADAVLVGTAIWKAKDTAAFYLEMCRG